jgi:hypothetical protein
MDEQSSFKKSSNLISSGDAARAFGVTNDYIARLCRQGKLEGKLEGRSWLVETNALAAFFEGQGRTPLVAIPTAKEYLSSREAATLYRVTNDYIARLGRQNKLVGELRDGVWMVEKNSLDNFFSHREPSQVEKPAQKIFAAPVVQEYFAPEEFSTYDESENNLRSKNVFQNKKFTFSFAALALAFLLIFATPVAAFLHLPPAGELAASVAHVDSPFFSPISGLISKILAFFSPTVSTPTPTSPVVQPVAQATSTPLVVNNYTTTNTTNNNTYNTTNSYNPSSGGGISKTEFDTRLNSLRQDLYTSINGISNPLTPNYAGGGTTNNIALSQIINHLDGVTISNSTVHSLSGLSDADIPDTITASNYLPLSGGTIAGNLTITGTCTGCGGGSSSDSNWSYFNNSGIQLATTTNQVLIGASSTSTLSKLEVVGGATFDQATSTSFYTTTASSTNFYGAGLASCTGGNVLTWANGSFGCAADQTSTGQANNFSFAINYGAISAATTSPIWAQNGIFASSTSHFANADFANSTTTGSRILVVGSVLVCLRRLVLYIFRVPMMYA